MDVSLISGAVSSLKTAFDIAKGISDLKSMTDVQGKVIELQQAILAAQSSAMAANSEQYAAMEELRKLREELDKLKGWQQEKDRYRLFTGEGTGGSVVFALRESQKKENEPAHYLCTNCYEQGRKSLLNNFLGPTGFTHWLCPVCKAQFPSTFRGAVAAKFAPD
jgi:rubrerythrin